MNIVITARHVIETRGYDVSLAVMAVLVTTLGKYNNRARSKTLGLLCPPLYPPNVVQR